MHINPKLASYSEDIEMQMKCFSGISNTEISKILGNDTAYSLQVYYILHIKGYKESMTHIERFRNTQIDPAVLIYLTLTDKMTIPLQYHNKSASLYYGYSLKEMPDILKKRMD